MKKQHYTGWISVDDELPFKDGEYLVIVQDEKGRRRDIAWFDLLSKKWMSMRLVVVEGDNSTVTHWMALPSLPPK